jgi:hypothetical protein
LNFLFARDRAAARAGACHGYTPSLSFFNPGSDPAGAQIILIWAPAGRLDHRGLGHLTVYDRVMGSWAAPAIVDSWARPAGN